MLFNRKIDNFAKIFFHDLKNKLLSIKLNLTLFKKTALKTLQDSHFNILERMEYNLEESIELVKNYLDLEKYKKTKFLKHTKTSLINLTEKILKSLQTEIESKNLSISFSKPQNAEVKINEDWLYKALYNIIHNAVKYNKKNGIIHITLSPRKKGYLLIIKDSGKGISEEEKDKIFNKFYTKDNKDGHGIGLYMTKVIIESFGGKIDINSKENKGSTFYIYIPKAAKQIKIKNLALSLASITIIGFFAINYFFCLIPQNIKVTVSDNTKIYKFENGITAIAGINDEIKIKAYKNLFENKTENKIFLKKGDVYINTSGEKLTLITPKGKFNNLGTKFETLSYKTTASSVYEGKIKTKNKTVNTDEGVILAKDIQIKHLPKPVEYIQIKSNENIKIMWSSPYKKSKILLSKDKNFINKPLMVFYSSKHTFSINNINDGLWYVKIRAVNENLLSKGKTKRFISLINYIKAKKAFEKENIPLALQFLKQSLKTINNTSYKPYMLYAKIMYLKNNLQEALKFTNKALQIKKENSLLTLKAKILYRLKKYKKIPNLITNITNEEAEMILAKTYIKLGKSKMAKKIIFRILEKNPKNIEAQKLLKKLNISIF